MAKRKNKEVKIKDEKIVKVDFNNPEARMKLKVKGKKATEQALKIMKAFDNACTEIRKEELKNE